MTFAGGFITGLVTAFIIWVVGTWVTSVVISEMDAADRSEDR